MREFMENQWGTRSQANMDRKSHRGVGPGTIASSTSAAIPTLGMANADAQDDAQDELVLWRRVLAELFRLAELQDKNSDTFTTLDKAPEGNPTRPASSYQEAVDRLRDERDIIQRALEILNIMLGIRDGDLSTDNSPEGKRKKRKIDAESLLSNSKKIRRYSSQDPNGIIPVGHQVAARTPKDKNKQEEWILARVLSYSAEKNKYVVEDDEADESGKKMTYTLSARGVIMIADEQDSVPEFPAGHTVLALYPSTTCFYRAIVVQSPSKNKDSVAPTYRIKFDDDGGNERTAPPRMVLDMPKLK